MTSTVEEKLKGALAVDSGCVLPSEFRKANPHLSGRALAFAYGMQGTDPQRVKRSFNTLIRAIEREGYSVFVDPGGNYSVELRHR